MKTIIVNGSESAILWLRSLAVAVELRLDEKLDILTPSDTATITITEKKAPTHGGHYGPRVCYKAINVEDAPQALAALGEHTIMGLIFSHIVGGTVSGERVTAQSLRLKTKFNAKTLESRINDLRTAKLVVSEEIPYGERMVEHGG